MEIANAAKMIGDEYQRLHVIWFGSQSDYPFATLKFIYLPDNPDDMLDLRGDVALRAATPPDFDWGYDHSTHILQCVIRQSDLDEGDGTRSIMIDKDQGENDSDVYRNDRIATWAYWRWNLVHEMCHEYEHRKLGSVATPQGWLLFDTSHIQNHKRIWPPPKKHPIAFYSAIASFAMQFGLNVDLLHDQI